MIVDHEIAHDSPKMSFAQGRDAIEALLLDGAHESLRIGIQVRASCRQGIGLPGFLGPLISGRARSHRWSREALVQTWRNGLPILAEEGLAGAARLAGAAGRHGE
jgi:hypothetical protein